MIENIDDIYNDNLVELEPGIVGFLQGCYNGEWQDNKFIVVNDDKTKWCIGIVLNGYYYFCLDLLKIVAQQNPIVSKYLLAAGLIT